MWEDGKTLTSCFQTQLSHFALQIVHISRGGSLNKFWQDLGGEFRGKEPGFRQTFPVIPGER